MDTRPDPTLDSEFFEKLGRLLTLNVDEFKAAIGGKIEEPTRGALVRANEVAFGRGQSSRCVLMDTGPYGVPLSFRGELLAEQSGPWERGTLLYRYFDLRVYEATVKAHAGQIVFRTSWPAEGDRHRAFFGATVKDCLEGFRAWVPSKESTEVGYPILEAEYQAIQKELMASLDALYTERLARLVESLPRSAA